MPQLIGWLSSLILIITISNQVWRQWRHGDSTETAQWLFWGQLSASIGFCVYSLLVRDWVFVATNAVMLVSAILGALIVRAQRKRGAGTEAATGQRNEQRAA